MLFQGYPNKFDTVGTFRARIQLERVREQPDDGNMIPRMAVFGGLDAAFPLIVVTQWNP